VDTSALIAILLDEPSKASLAIKLLSTPSVIAAPNLLEAHMVLQKVFGAQTGNVLHRFLVDFGIIVVPFTSLHESVAAAAFEQYGKGRHPAGLNFGECIAYALSKATSSPILFVGDDFALTDLLIA
jgi:ribonuclease VapC